MGGEQEEEKGAAPPWRELACECALGWDAEPSRSRQMRRFTLHPANALSK